MALDVRWLLYELCTKLGYCLPPEAQQRLMEDPPLDPEAFSDAVLLAEGLDPRIHDAVDVRDMVREHFQRG